MDLEAERLKGWRDTWTKLISSVSADTLHGMYISMTGGDNLLGALIGGGPYAEDLGTAMDDSALIKLDDEERSDILDDLKGATDGRMTVADVFALEKTFSNLIAQDQVNTTPDEEG